MSNGSIVSRRGFLAGAVGTAVLARADGAGGEDSPHAAQIGPPTAATASHPLLTKSDLDAIATKVSNWGRWGKDDQQGTVNLITPAKRRQALGLPREGITVSLSHAQSTEKSAWNVNPLVHTVRTNVVPGPDPDAYAADSYTMDYHGGGFTHMDALCHCFHQGRAYNGVTRDAITSEGAEKLGIEAFREGIVTRGVLIDIPRLRGVPYLDPDGVVYPDDLDAWEARAKLKISSGDLFLLRTGRWARYADKGPWDVMTRSAGLHASCIPWLHDRDVAVLGSDAISDVVGLGYQDFVQPIHSIVLSRMGTPIVDNCDLEALGETCDRLKRWEFLVMAAPMVIPKGTGSPLNPIAVL